ncbi:polysaccharide deacetylase family protein [Tenacibaculum sp. 47A_GOM-205m]|uniref:polysaccharide deacetylase family protein n=1 Tax=Tenacibaculum sp. 47A_GOM-205m TaxID=1380384 RepID=UPI00048F4518|nr:polysaccharide deacetylase family protein [Tenacibaculum sp. 47A_GOM-205m]
MNKGKFIISLDFELRWGGVEKWSIEQKTSYFLKTRKSIPEVLLLFKQNSIKATWATVGFLFAKDKKQLLDYSPSIQPSYSNQKISSYNYFNEIGNNEKNDPYHFANSLITKILETSGQELGTHTFSHYYCNEPGQNLNQFKADLKSVQNLAKENFGISLKSLVFPRNQYNPQYLNVAQKEGVKVIRSNPDVWFWKNTQGKMMPVFRAMDTLFSIGGSLSYDSNNLKINDKIVELPASRFFRPYKDKEKFIQQLKMNRIKGEMTYAAKNNLDYHLWWHPHNFAENINKNHNQLIEIINHFKQLNDKYGFESATMGDYAMV